MRDIQFDSAFTLALSLSLSLPPSNDCVWGFFCNIKTWLLKFRCWWYFYFCLVFVVFVVRKLCWIRLNWSSKLFDSCESFGLFILIQWSSDNDSLQNLGFYSNDILLWHTFALMSTFIQSWFFMIHNWLINETIFLMLEYTRFVNIFFFSIGKKGKNSNICRFTSHKFGSHNFITKFKFDQFSKIP